MTKKEHLKILKEYSLTKNIRTKEDVVKFLKRRGIKHRFENFYYAEEDDKFVFTIKELGWGLFELNAIELTFPISLMKSVDGIYISKSI